MSHKSQPNTSTQIPPVSSSDTSVIQEASFSFDGYEVVHGEFFTLASEPYVTFNRGKVLVNAACIRKVPDLDYVQFLVNQTEKRFVIKPCPEETVNSFRWISYNIDGWRHPKAISSKVFFAKVMDLMNWDADCRYRILGKLIRSNEEKLFVFDLTAAEASRRKASAGSSGRSRSYYPAEWRDRFGIPAKEYRNLKLIDIVDEYTVLQLDDAGIPPTEADGSSPLIPESPDNTTDQESEG